MVLEFLKFRSTILTAIIAIGLAKTATADDVLMTKAPSFAFGPAYDWNGFYAGGNLALGWGRSSWTASPGITGAIDLFQSINTFYESGSFMAGLEAGYNYVLPNRILFGAEVDASFPSFPNLAGISVGGGSTFTSPALGAVSYSETVLASGTARGRIGYSPGNWLLYATGGIAWTYDQQALTQLTAGATESPFLWRLGWAAGAGLEVPIAPSWTARLEYLFTDYGHKNTVFFGTQPLSSDFLLQQLHVGVNYQFGVAGPATPIVRKAPTAPELDNVAFHGQATFTWQAYPAFRSPYQGTNSLPGGGEGRETADLTLFAGVRLWQGAEVWVNPEVDQGFGLANTHGVAGFPSA